MSVAMPIYTVAILVFFIYTIVKILFKNKDKDKEEDEDDEEFLNSDYYKNHLAQQKAAAKKNVVKTPIDDEEKVKNEPSPSQKETGDKNELDQVKPVKTKNIVRFNIDEKMEDNTGKEDEKPDGKEGVAVEEKKEGKIAPKESSSQSGNTAPPPVTDPSKGFFTQIFVYETQGTLQGALPF